MKDYKDLVTRLRKAAAEEPVERRQLLLRAASAIDELQKESSESVKLLDDYASSARVIALYLKQFCDTSLNYPNMIADAARKACEALEKYKQAEKDGRLVILPFPQNKSLLDMSNPENPNLLVNFRVAIAYNHCEIVFHQPFNIFMENVERGYICPVSEEAEAVLEGGKDG